MSALAKQRIPARRHDGQHNQMRRHHAAPDSAALRPAQDRRPLPAAERRQEARPVPALPRPRRPRPPHAARLRQTPYLPGPPGRYRLRPHWADHHPHASARPHHAPSPWDHPLVVPHSDAIHPQPDGLLHPLVWAHRPPSHLSTLTTRSSHSPTLQAPSPWDRFQCHHMALN